jgi:hypothetical protein
MVWEITINYDKLSPIARFIEEILLKKARSFFTRKSVKEQIVSFFLRQHHQMGYERMSEIIPLIAHKMSIQETLLLKMPQKIIMTAVNEKIDKLPKTVEIVNKLLCILPPLPGESYLGILEGVMPQVANIETLCAWMIRFERTCPEATKIIIPRLKELFKDLPQDQNGIDIILSWKEQLKSMNNIESFLKETLPKIEKLEKFVTWERQSDGYYKEMFISRAKEIINSFSPKSEDVEKLLVVSKKIAMTSSKIVPSITEKLMEVLVPKLDKNIARMIISSIITIYIRGENPLFADEEIAILKKNSGEIQMELLPERTKEILQDIKK